MGIKLFNQLKSLPVVETNHIAAVRRGAYSAQYPVVNNVALQNGMLVVVDHEDKLIRLPVLGTENCGLVVSEERVFESYKGRNTFAGGMPKVAALKLGDIFETNAVDLGAFGNLALAKTGAKYGIPTTTGYITIVDNTAGVAALSTHDLVLQIIEWVELPNGEQGIKFVVAKSVPTLLSDSTMFGGFRFNAADNPALTADIEGVYADNTINLVVPSDTDVSALIGSWSAVSPVTVDGDAVAGGVSELDFSDPVIFTVTSPHGGSAEYTVIVTVADAAVFTAFNLLADDNDGVILADVAGVIVGTDITVTVPNGTVVTNLIPSWTANGVVEVGAVAQESGVSAFDFTNPIEFVVNAAYDETATYTVTVIIEE